jgi:hypothetical protein
MIQATTAVNAIAVLAFKYNKDDNDLLEKYIQESIDLKDSSTEDRLKKIVLFFAKQTQPIAHIRPSENLGDGLERNYKRDIQYIIGPHARFVPPREKTLDYIKIDRKLLQLCVRCDSVDRMKDDLEMTLQRQVAILHTADSEIMEIGKTFRYSRRHLIGPRKMITLTD